MKKYIHFILILTILICSTNTELFSNSSKQVKIAAIFPNSSEARWTSDSKAMKDMSSKMNIKYDEYYGYNTIESQVSLVDRAARNGVDIIILPISGVAGSSQVIQRASANGIKVVTYLNTPEITEGISMHVAFNYYMAGYNQMNSTFKQAPYGIYMLIMGLPTDHRFISSYKGSIEAFKTDEIRKSIKIIIEPYRMNWNNQAIKDFIKRSIEKNPDISAIILADDSMAILVIEALRELGLEKKILVSGQNLTTVSAGYILDNSLLMSTYPHQNDLAIEALEIAYKIAKANPTGANNNGEPITIGGNVLPTHYIAPKIINKPNIEVNIFKKGYMVKR